MAIRVGLNEYDLLKDCTGKPLCCCGCQELFHDGEKVFWLNVSQTTPGGGLRSTGGPLALVKLDHIQRETSSSNLGYDGRREDLLKLSHNDPVLLKALYTFMHDALGCRI